MSLAGQGDVVVNAGLSLQMEAVAGYRNTQRCPDQETSPMKDFGTNESAVIDQKVVGILSCKYARQKLPFHSKCAQILVAVLLM